MTEKNCSTCGALKPLSEYQLRKDTGKYRKQCKVCHGANCSAWAKDNKDKRAEDKRKRYQAKKEHCKAVDDAWRKAHPEKVKGYRLKTEAKAERKQKKADYQEWYKAEYPDKLKVSYRKYQLAHPDVIRRNSSKRRAQQVKATPNWFEADLVARVYAEAAKWGFEVDHIVPLRGKTVCGLHCWANLQLMPRKENISKGNRHWPDMP